MPWDEKSVTEMKLEFVKQALETQHNISALCSRYGISRKTGYKWIQRYKMSGTQGLKEHSRKPSYSPDRIASDIVSQILELKVQYPYWGARKLHALLLERGITAISVSSVHRVLKRAGYTQAKGYDKRSHIRFEHQHANDLWQMDFKGHFACGQKRCHPLTIIDDHSRFLIALKASPNERGETIKPWIREVFKRYGLPSRINVDNGSPWGSLYDCARYTSFSLWIIDHGVHVSYSRPRHPQTNGKDERLHRTLKEELLAYQSFVSLSQAQQAFDHWREQYNCIRPHQALGYSQPIKRYQPSIRTYQDKVEPYEYADDYQLYQPDTRGRVRIEGRSIFVGVPFKGRVLGMRQTDQHNQIEMYYRHHKLGTVMLDKIAKGEMVNLYSNRRLVV